MFKKKNVLVFPAGTEIASEIFNALKLCKFVTLFGGTSVNDHSEYMYKNLIKDIPFIHENGFIEAFNRILSENKIDCVYPAYDPVIEFFNENSDKINAQLIIADKTTTSVCRSKSQSYKLFKGEWFVPELYERDSVLSFPVFVKPDMGQGSQGAHIARDTEELDFRLEHSDNPIICEFLSGDEYTVDCFTDGKGELRVAKQRTRERIRNGISVRSRSLDKDDNILEMATKINEKLNFKGAWFFQTKKDKNGVYKLLEISPRIPGTMGLSRNCGINYPLLTLFVFWGYDVDIIDNGYEISVDRALYGAYKINLDYTHIYLDFDDTLIIDNKVNTQLMSFIYQAINEDKIIHLLSRHEGNIHEDLKKYRISEELFEDITVLGEGDEKINYITEQSAIFIDDSFAERIKVASKRNIAVFDVDMVESLINYKA